jgi:aspartyl-tRNA(Asn)/glutamyl-tRNA(Gln) amidotransferase subunit A
MLNTLTLKQAIDKLKAKEISSAELYADVHKTVAEKNAQLNVYLTLNERAEEAAAQAATSDLAGVPIAVKDNFLTKGLRTTASSTVLESFIPPYESTVTSRLLAKGGVIYGKTNLDAWAHGSSTETSQFGRTLNPRNPDYLPGGSSGGSAAAIAADMCIAALGTETAGSIRQPSSWCGTVGLKPTYGRVSRYGVISMASSTDSPGPITKTVEDAAILLNVIAGKDEYDGTSSATVVPDYTSFLGKDLKGLKIGILYSDMPELNSLKQYFEPVYKVLQELGAELDTVQAMDPHYAISVYTVVQRGEVSSNLARFDGVRFGTDRSQFGPEAKRRIMLGTYTLSKGIC